LAYISHAAAHPLTALSLGTRDRKSKEQNSSVESSHIACQVYQAVNKSFQKIVLQIFENCKLKNVNSGSSQGRFEVARAHLFVFFYRLEVYGVEREIHGESFHVNRIFKIRRMAKPTFLARNMDPEGLTG
jgi:hypothetical protein